MIISVFCRNMHPHGYGGFPYYIHESQGAPQNVVSAAQTNNESPDSGRTAAHGYVTLVVLAEDYFELYAVRDALVRKWFAWNNREDAWYGGMFDLVWSIELEDQYPWTAMKMDGRCDFHVGEWNSYGDNRACAYLKAKEILDAYDCST